MIDPNEEDDNPVEYRRYKTQCVYTHHVIIIIIFSVRWISVSIRFKLQYKSLVAMLLKRYDSFWLNLYILAHCMFMDYACTSQGGHLHTCIMYWMYIYRCCHFFHIKINEFLMRQFPCWKICFSLVMKLCKWGWREFQRKLERNSSFFSFSLNYVSLLSDTEKCKPYDVYVHYFVQ